MFITVNKPKNCETVRIFKVKEAIMKCGGHYIL